MKKFLRKISNLTLSLRVFIVIIFIALMGVSVYMMNQVSINYDLSKYLGSDTETSKALKVIQDEFGENGNLQVMVSGINEEDAENLKDDLENIDHVIIVSFDKDDTNYYKDLNALFILLIDGNDYSENATDVTNDVEDLIESKYQDVYYGGTTIEKQRLKEGITSQMPIILVGGVSFISLILLLISTSWIEPILLLACTGIAVLINLGTNLIFGEISYITNSVCAILQMALSMDYSIVLLNSYKKNKESIRNPKEAMSKSMVQVLNPISASGLTTIFGLIALLLMSFKIGYDIGVVLIKGILISLICSLVLLPCVILLFNNQIEKTKKKALKFNGNWIAGFTKKLNKPVVFLTIILIIAGAVLNFALGTYTFNDSNDADKEIGETFGNNNTICLVYNTSDNSLDNEEAFIADISRYYTAGGVKVIKNYTALSNTTKEEYDVEKASTKLDISLNEAELLLGLYNLDNNGDLIKLDSNTFLYKAVDLVNNDEDALDLVDGDTKETLDILKAIDIIGKNSYTYDEFYDELNAKPLSSLESTVTLFELKQIYGTYYFSNVEDEAISFNIMLDYIVENADNERLSSSLTDEEKAQLSTLSTYLKEFEKMLTEVEFQYYMYQEYGVSLNEFQVAYIYGGYYNSIGEDASDTAPIIPILNYMVDSGMIADTNAIQTIKGYYTILSSSKSGVTYKEFIPLLENIATSLTGSNVNIDISDEETEQIYILYYNENDRFIDKKLTGLELSSFMTNEIDNDTYISKNMSERNINDVEDLSNVLSFLNNTSLYNYKEMYEKIDELENKLNTETVSMSVDADKVSGVYLKYALANDSSFAKGVIAEDILYFVDQNKETNTLLKEKLTASNLEKIADAKSDLNTAEDLLIGENYTRLLLSTDLPNESDDTTRFVNYLEVLIIEYFGDDAYIGGEVVSTDDLSSSFVIDQVIISVVSIVSILIIILLIFHNALLPFILLLIIQGAIWVAFATNSLSGNIFFMSYIIASSILMGATIDYGILMGSTYISKRNKLDKNASLKEAINVALPTIFTSGLILTVCGFIIYLFAKQSSISTVGLLLGKGAIASALLVLVSLPSFLYLLDEPLLNARIGKKKEQ